MKALGIILKIVTALAAIAGVVYVVATYGDKIVAWAKSMLGKFCCCECCDCCECEEDEAPAEEVVPAEEGAVQAEETDFEG